MGKTLIEWTDRSINPLRARLGESVGHYCEKVSPGCKHCYSSRTQPRFRMPTFQEQRRLDVSTFLDPSKLEEVLRRRVPTKWFWCDMTDMFGDWVPFEVIAACFGVMAATPWHTHQVLTKRADRMADVVPRLRFDGAGNGRVWVAERADSPGYRLMGGAGCTGLPNVWLGVSCEDQQRADERIPLLLQTPAAVRFVSAEPLLGRVLFDNSETSWLSCNSLQNDDYEECCISFGRGGPHFRGIDWVIVGGESGPGARPCDIEWIRSIVAQCKTAGTAVFVKQLGAKPYMEGSGAERFGWPCGFDVRGGSDAGDIQTHLSLSDGKGGDMAEWPEDLRVREFPRGA